jgi:hypothetical protein
MNVLTIAFLALPAAVAVFAAVMWLAESWRRWGWPGRAIAVGLGASLAGLALGRIAVQAPGTVLLFLGAALLIVGRLGLPARWIVRGAAVVLTLAALDAGSAKAPTSTQVRAWFVSLMMSGELRGPTNYIASAVNAAAVQAVVDESSNMVVTASNALAWAREEIPALEAVVTNTHISWLSADSAEAAGSNPVARCELIHAKVNTNAATVDAYLWFNLTPASAPIVPFEASVDSNGVEWATFPAVSNSFPSKVPIETSSGVVSCYVYTVSIPAEFQTLQLVPQTQVTFGGGASNSQLMVLGSVMMNGAIGRTTITTNGAYRLVHEGGVLVGVL